MEYISQSELILYLVLTAAMFGIIWIVQLVIYPGFKSIGEAEWANYHKEYTSLVSWIVAPLMLAEFALAAWLAMRSGGVEGDWFLPFVLLLLIWLSTFFLQIPQHNKLVEQKDLAIISKLINGNWIRTFLWSIKLIYICFIVYEALL